MAFLQKTWKDRVAEYINRRVLTKEDGTTELVSVERSEGTISQEGDAFSAANMNDLEQRIANEFSEQNKNLNSVFFTPDFNNKQLLLKIGNSQNGVQHGSLTGTISENGFLFAADIHAYGTEAWIQLKINGSDVLFVQAFGTYTPVLKGDTYVTVSSLNCELYFLPVRRG